MDEVYTVFRVIYLIWSAHLFWYMVYWGIQDVMIGRRCGHVQVPPEHYLFAFSAAAGSFVLAASLAEIFLKDVPGGWRTFMPVLMLVPSTIGAHQGAFRIKMHRMSVQLGACQGGHAHDDV